MQRKKHRSRFRYLPERLILCVARRFDLGPIRLFVFLQTRAQANELRSKTVEALALIERYSPNHFSRVRRFIPRILIFGAHAYTAVYISELGLCDISRHYALADKTTSSGLAMTLVHEATHGYLESQGIRYDEHQRERIEKVCLRTEIAFARRLSESSELVAGAEDRLLLSSDYWKTESFVQRNLEHLKEIRAPRWLVRFAEWRVERFIRKAREKERTNESQPAGSDKVPKTPTDRSGPS